MAQLNWKQLHRRSLELNQPETFRELTLSGRLDPYLLEVDQVARESYLSQVERLQQKTPKWTPDQIERSAQEVVLQEIVLVRDQETLEAEAQGGYLD